MHARTAVGRLLGRAELVDARQMSVVDGRNRPRSSCGTPSNSAITATGSGSASVEIRSNSPPPLTLLTNPSIIRWIRSRIPSTIRA